MTKKETMDFLKRIKTYYQTFSIEDYVIDEWHKKLKPYELSDVEEKLEEHLKGDLADRPPMLHYLTKYLKTPEEKERLSNDYYIQCNGCGKWMFMSDYDNDHFERCLTIRTLISFLKRKDGREIPYEELDQYDTDTINRIYDKYEEEIKLENKSFIAGIGINENK